MKPNKFVVLVVLSAMSLTAVAVIGPAPALAHRAEAPMALTARGPERVAAGAVIEVTATLMRTAWKALPLQLAWQLPAGVRLVGGAPSEPLAAGKANVLTRKVKLAVDKLPADDLVVVVDGEGKGAGIHLRAVYRFGRPLPAAPAPAKGPTIKVGNLKTTPGKPLKPD